MPFSELLALAFVVLMVFVAEFFCVKITDDAPDSSESMLDLLKAIGPHAPLGFITWVVLLMMLFPIGSINPPQWGSGVDYVALVLFSVSIIASIFIIYLLRAKTRNIRILMLTLFCVTWAVGAIACYRVYELREAQERPLYRPLTLRRINRALKRVSHDYVLTYGTHTRENAAHALRGCLRSEMRRGHTLRVYDLRSCENALALNKDKNLSALFQKQLLFWLCLQNVLIGANLAPSHGRENAQISARKTVAPGGPAQ